ncbi:hypothetical protein CYLTODRAFT_386603 [Cylindrobasidium torrendii FP15055 ss-10]|uniref:Uncharacterized protein n=1 Tax=Cylindrobasidium torrendii FP15055 ss-10 TaxID=1314674 RepID=A0A0D7BTB8_9AGAR|nr:hypothetical protein CYLTODRAFT_386603 [Cylindrobasidium torrendii FP15055 ss-10]
MTIHEQRRLATTRNRLGLYALVVLACISASSLWWGFDVHTSRIASSIWGAIPAQRQPLTTVAVKSIDRPLEVDEIQALVSSTKGFLSRDWSLGLGWNNMRYIIESGLLEAKLLNRTLVLPSFVYARHCEHSVDVCATHAPMVNKNDVLHSTEWRALPLADQMAWQIPIDLMLNITHIRQKHHVITAVDYLRLHGLNGSTEALDGRWSLDAYHTQPHVFTNQYPSLRKIQHVEYEPKHVVRVDYVPPALLQKARVPPQDKALADALTAALPDDRAYLTWMEAQSVTGLWSDAGIEEALDQNGWAVLWTYAGVNGMELNKAVVLPMRQAAPILKLRGLKNEFVSWNQTVVHLEGEVHLGKKPGSLRFTTREALDEYTRTVLYDMTQTNVLYGLADCLIQRMYNLTEGRLWTGAHVRRGDFLLYNWAMEIAASDHIQRVKDRLVAGRATLKRLSARRIKTYDVPGAYKADERLHTYNLPQETDKYFIATDERDPTTLDVFRAAGAVTMTDLLTLEDRRRTQTLDGDDLGWVLLFTDVRAVVEQIVLAEAGYFYGHAMSSVAGGIINMRAKHGRDPRTALVD